MTARAAPVIQMTATQAGTSASRVMSSPHHTAGDSHPTASDSHRTAGDSHPTEAPTSKLKTWQLMVSSCSGALVVSLMVTPLDVVKIRMQVQSRRISAGQCFAYCNGLWDHLNVCANGGGTSPPHWYKKPAHFTGTLDGFLKIARTEGITKLWSGLPPTLVMAVPATVIYYSLYDTIKYKLGFRDGDVSTISSAASAAAISRVAAVSIISPLELTRTKLQSQQMSYRYVANSLGDTVRSEGVLSLWRGLPATLWRDVPFSMIYWALYETVKDVLVQRRLTATRSDSAEVDQAIRPIESIIAGSLGGFVAVLVTMPFDVIKTHQQVDMGVIAKRPSLSTVATLRELRLKHGMRSLFAGVGPRCLRIVPSCAIMVTIFETGKHFFAQRNRLVVETTR